MPSPRSSSTRPTGRSRTRRRSTVGGREVELRFLGRGHTDHDAVITVPGTGMVWAGDLLEQGNVPFFGDGYPLDWVATSAAVAALVDPDGGVVVPGHGDHAGRAFADAQAGSFAALAALARRVHDRDLDLTAAIAEHPFPDQPPEDASEAFRAGAGPARRKPSLTGRSRPAGRSVSRRGRR